MQRRFLLGALALAFLAPPCAGAETDQNASASTEAASDSSGLLTPEESQNLMAPVALYPDTLLIQILVAATVPLDIMKADRFLHDNQGVDAEALQPQTEAQGWDDSITVLAEAFPGCCDADDCPCGLETRDGHRDAGPGSGCDGRDPGQTAGGGCRQQPG